MKRKYIYIIVLALVSCALVAIGITRHFSKKAVPQPLITKKIVQTPKPKAQVVDTLKQNFFSLFGMNFVRVLNILFFDEKK